jgi:hypothetical protein
MCSDTVETHPDIQAHTTADAAPAYDVIIATSQALVKQSLEAAALVKATREKLAMYEHDAETLGRVKKELSAAGHPVAAPDLTVRELCESEKSLREGVAIWRKLLDAMGYDKGSIPERLKAVDAALKKVTRPMVPASTSAEGYYDHEMYPGPESTLTKEQSNLNAWQRTLSRADRILDYYDIPCNAIQADGTRKVLFIDERVELLVQKLDRQTAPAKKVA